MLSVMINKIPVCVLISGNGSNLQALIDACAAPDYPAEIIHVISNKADAYGLQRAALAHIPSTVLSHKGYASREAYDQELHKIIMASGAQIVCLAGFMRLLSADFVLKWQGRMLNIHPSLLPEYKGLNTHARALADGKKEVGCTVHYVVPEMDAGEIIMQQRVAVIAGDTAESVQQRVHQAEHIIYPEALRTVAVRLL
jgi:phosphoribosylglycinamide formyltransferase 1